MALFGTGRTPIVKRTYVSSSYATGSSGRLITLTLSNSLGAESISYDATTSLMFELGQSLITGSTSDAIVLDPSGPTVWTYRNVSSSVGTLNGYESRIDIGSTLNEYRVYITGSDDRETFGYHMMGLPRSIPAAPAGLADYIIAQWSADSVSVTGTDIDTLTDEQSGGFDLTTTGTARATYQATSGPSSGPAIYFDGTDDRYQLDSITRPQPHAMVITAEFIDSDDVALHGFDSNNYQVAFSWSLNIYAGGGGSLSSDEESYGTGFNTWVFYFNGNSSTITKNNVLKNTGGGGAPGSSDDPGISLGGAYDGASYYAMRIARLTLVDATDTADVQTVADTHATDFGTYTP